MKISQANSSTLLVSITDAIQQGEVEDFGDFEFSEGWQDKTLAALGADFSKALAKALDGSTLQQFVRNRLRMIMTEQGIKLPTEPTGIATLECFKDPLNVARDVLAHLEQTPIEYRMVTRVMGEFARRLDLDSVSVPLSDRLTLLSGAQLPPSFQTKHKTVSVDREIRGYRKIEELKVEDKALYLEYRASGYLSRQKLSRIVGDYYDEVRAFYGACVAHGILSNHPSFFAENLDTHLIANSIIGSQEAFAFVERAEEDILRCANLTTSSDVDMDIEANVSVATILAPVVKVFSSASSQKLKTACAWCLRANLSTRELDKILESAITIEVLLGDRDTSDRIGLTKLIANRCAYALGRSAKERDEITEFFGQFYKVRSEVVHSGRTALQTVERKIVDQGLNLATRILKHEIALASDD
jgi:hypothetical protein